MTQRKKKRRRRWLKRLGVLFVALLVAAVLFPFFFTTAVVRWALAHSAYSRFSPAISKASLGPTGVLTLHDLELFEAGPLSDAPLLSAKQLQIGFSWWKVLGMTISSARVEGLVVHVRPGRTYPVTLLTLSYPPGMDGVPPEPHAAAPPPGAGNPFWFDRLHATGTLKVHPFESFQVSNRDLPLTLDMAMHGARNDPHRDLTLALGEPATARAAAATQSTTSTAPARRPLAEVGPAMTASLRMVPLGGGKTQIVIDHGEGWNLGAALEPELLRRWLPALGGNTDRVEVLMDRASVSGTVEPNAGNNLWFKGQVDVHDVSLAGGRGDALGLDQFSLSAKVETPLIGGSLTDVSIHDATTGLGTLNYNSFAAGRTLVEWSLDQGVLNVRTLQAAALDGTLNGNLQLHLPDLGQTQGKLILEHVEARQIMSLLPASQQGAFAARGHVSGEVELKQTAHGVEGTLGLLPGNDLAMEVDGLAASPGPWNPGATQARQIEARLTATRQGNEWELAIPRIAIAALAVRGDAEALRKKWPVLPTDIKGPLEMTIGTIEGDERMEGETGHKQAVGRFKLGEISLQTPQSKDYPLGVEHLTAAATFNLPMEDSAAKGLEMPTGNLTAATAQLGKMQASELALDWTLLDGTWRVKENKLTFFGAQVTGEVTYHQKNGLLETGRLNIEHLDQHQFLTAIKPEKVDAEGSISGPVEFWNVLDSKSGRGGPLQFKGNLVADGPGRLMIKDEQVAQQLTLGLNQVHTEMIPQNFGDIVKEQLKNYRYLEGHVTLESVENKPVLHLDYRRAPLIEGEPGYGVKQTIGGQELIVNYPIQLAGVTVRFGNKSVDELMEMIGGWQRDFKNGTTADEVGVSNEWIGRHGRN